MECSEICSLPVYSTARHQTRALACGVLGWTVNEVDFFGEPRCRIAKRSASEWIPVFHKFRSIAHNLPLNPQSERVLVHMHWKVLSLGVMGFKRTTLIYIRIWINLTATAITKVWKTSPTITWKVLCLQMPPVIAGIFLKLPRDNLSGVPVRTSSKNVFVNYEDHLIEQELIACATSCERISRLL